MSYISLFIQITMSASRQTWIILKHQPMKTTPFFTILKGAMFTTHCSC